MKHTVLSPEFSELVSLCLTCLCFGFTMVHLRAVVGGPAGPAMAGPVLGHTKKIFK